MSQPDPRAVSREIIDLVYHQPHIDAGTPLEELHLVESIADILEEAFDQIEADETQAFESLEIQQYEDEMDILRQKIHDLEADLEFAGRKIIILESNMEAA